MGNVQKTLRYLKRNGISSTYYAAKERLLETKGVPYDYALPSESELSKQRKESEGASLLISIVVPVYETPERFLRELIDSCIAQTYPCWELILADASLSDGPRNVIDTFTDERIVYRCLSENGGISANTNAAVSFAKGDYAALLDHDDLLTPDAMYEVACVIERSRKNGVNPAFVYSDEDKCDGEAKHYYEPNIKPEYNFDYLLSNNYICHLSVIERSLLLSYPFRKEYDGAQDHDLILRITGDLFKKGERERILHIPKVLYHWRCHEASTASNTDSKNYAYESGLKCVADYTKVEIEHSMHKGFYVPLYGKDLFILRPEIGAVGGLMTRGNKITGGLYDESGECTYKNMNKHFSGYLHRLHCRQEAYALDIRNLTPNPTLSDLYAESLYGLQLDLELIKSDKNTDREGVIRKWNLHFANEARKRGFILVYDPSYRRGMGYNALKESDRLPVSVVIPNYNGKDYLKPCIDSVMASDPAPREIIVVDNGSADGSTELLKSVYPEVILIEHKDNLGFTGAVNHGITRASQPYVFLLNNDTTIEPDCIEKLVKAMDSDHKVFSAGALMLSMDHPELVDNAGDSYNLLGYPRSFATGKSGINYFGDNSAKVFTACAGAAMYRKDLLKEIGLFDDRHFAYFEDADIGYRARIYGYSNVNVRNAVVYHKGSAVSGSRHNRFKVNLSSQNGILLFMKNMPLLQLLINLPFLLLGILIKAAFFTLKGFGGTYIKGVFRGIGMSFGRAGRAHHVRFRFRNICNYLKIELWMIKSTFTGR